MSLLGSHPSFSFSARSHSYISFGKSTGSPSFQDTCVSLKGMHGKLPPRAVQTSVSLKTTKCLNPCIINDVPKSLLFPSGVLNHLNVFLRNYQQQHCDGAAGYKWSQVARGNVRGDGTRLRALAVIRADSFPITASSRRSGGPGVMGMDRAGQGWAPCIQPGPQHRPAQTPLHFPPLGKQRSFSRWWDLSNEGRLVFVVRECAVL